MCSEVGPARVICNSYKLNIHCLDMHTLSRNKSNINTIKETCLFDRFVDIFDICVDIFDMCIDVFDIFIDMFDICIDIFNILLIHNLFFHTSPWGLLYSCGL